MRIPNGSIESDVADDVWTIAFDIPSLGCECEIRVGEDDALKSGDVPDLCQLLDASQNSQNMYLMIRESNISSTPALGFPANTGGTETTIDEVTSWNSRSRPLPLSFGFTASVFLSFLDGCAFFVSPVLCLRFEGGWGEEGAIWVEDEREGVGSKFLAAFT